MSLLRRNKSRESDQAAAKNAVDRFWGVSNGAPGDLAATEVCLRECQLNCDDYRKLRVALPLECGGTTGARVARIDRVLKRLELEA